MSAWRRLKPPNFCERLIGFSIPPDGQVLVVSYEGAHLLTLEPEVTVETDEGIKDREIYDVERGVARYKDREYSMLGLHGGSPIHISPLDERLELDRESMTLSTFASDGSHTFSTPYKNFSGDWEAATFS